VTGPTPRYCYSYLHVYDIAGGWQAIWLYFDRPVPGWAGDTR